MWTSQAYGYPASWTGAAVHGYLEGRFGDGRCSMHYAYRALRPLSPERFCFRYQFNRGRAIQERRVAAGLEQAPGSVYDSRLDDGRGAHHDPHIKARMRRMRDAENEQREAA